MRWLTGAGGKDGISAFDNPRATQLPTSRTAFWCQWSLCWIAASVASTYRLPIGRSSGFAVSGDGAFGGAVCSCDFGAAWRSGAGAAKDCASADAQ